MVRWPKNTSENCECKHKAECDRRGDDTEFSSGLFLPE
jgi:hypothetical protein